MTFDPLRAVISAVVAVLLVWGCCALWDWIATRGNDFPNGLLCILTIIAGVIWWVWFNFGNVLRR